MRCRKAGMKMESRIPSLIDTMNGDGSVPESASVSRDELSGAVEDVQEQLQRLQADFVNFRRRVSNIADKAADDRAAEILTLLLPVLDNFDRALTAETSDATYAEGVRLTYRHLMGVVTSLGLKPIHAVGERFDPNLHYGVASLMTEEATDGSVIEELRKGYLLKGRLLRPAQVYVAASPGTDG